LTTSLVPKLPGLIDKIKALVEIGTMSCALEVIAIFTLKRMFVCVAAIPDPADTRKNANRPANPERFKFLIMLLVAAGIPGFSFSIKSGERKANRLLSFRTENHDGRMSGFPFKVNRNPMLFAACGACGNVIRGP